MSANQWGVDAKTSSFVKRFAPLHLKAYQDEFGKWCIGYGHTGADINAESTITEQAADELLIKDLTASGNGVNAVTTAKINKHQFDALVSFVHNLGIETLQQSTLIRLINLGKFDSAANEFPRFTKAGGRESPSLLKRRYAERELFLTPF